MAAKIVVTGFEPWEHGAANPTLEVLKQLDSANDIGGDLTLVRLPVDSNRIAEITSRTLDEVRPDLWISLGLAPGLAVVAIERITANVMDFPVPDNASTQYSGKPVFSDSPAAHLATLPVKLIAEQLRAGGIPAKISNSPSTYLCNQMMYTVLYLIAKKGMKVRAGFIHVPAHPSLAAIQSYPLVEMPFMSVELMTAAVKTAIRISLSTAKDSHEPAFN